MTFEATLRANGRDWVLSTDIYRARGAPHDKRAVLSPQEIVVLKTALGKRQAPARLASSLWGIKTILGGELIECTLLDNT